MPDLSSIRKSDTTYFTDRIRGEIVVMDIVFRIGTFRTFQMLHKARGSKGSDRKNLSISPLEETTSMYPWDKSHFRRKSPDLI
jgi:hypothetical protein